MCFVNGFYLFPPIIPVFFPFDGDPVGDAIHSGDVPPKKSFGHILAIVAQCVSSKWARCFLDSTEGRSDG